MNASLGQWAPGSRQSGVEQVKIPLSLPLQRETFYFPLCQRLSKKEGGIFGQNKDQLCGGYRGLTSATALPILRRE